MATREDEMMMSRIRRGWVGTLVLAVLVGTAPAPAQSEEKPAGSASYDLRQAASLAGMAKGRKGVERLEALERAADAYRAVISSHPEDTQGCARAWFEVAELERRKGNLSAAEKGYAKAASMDPDRYAARASLEKGHVQRRLDRIDDALATYREVASLDPASSRAHTARVWIGGCLQIRGDLDGAVRAFSEALGKTEKPAHVIDLCNRMGKALLALGDLDGAEAAVARAEKAVAGADEEGAQQLKKALAKMSVRKALQRARDKENDAHEDARRLEEEKEGAKEAKSAKGG